MFEVLEQHVDTDNSRGAEYGFGEHTEPAQTSYRSGTPDGRSGSETFNRVAVFEDNTGTQETDSGNHLRNDTTVVSAYDVRRHKDIQRTAYCNERYRTCAHYFSMQLTLHTHQVT